LDNSSTENYLNFLYDSTQASGHQTIGFADKDILECDFNNINLLKKYTETVTKKSNLFKGVSDAQVSALYVISIAPTQHNISRLVNLTGIPQGKNYLTLAKQMPYQLITGSPYETSIRLPSTNADYFDTSINYEEELINSLIWEYKGNFNLKKNLIYGTLI
jgi:hypothetical protein